MFSYQFSKREKITLGLTTVILAGFLVYNFVFNPLIERLNNLNQQIILKEAKLKKHLKILSEEPSIESAFKNYADYIKQTTSEEQEMASLLSKIETVASQVNIHISDMKPRKPKSSDFYKILSVEIEAEGELEALMQFIYTLQNTPHLLKAEKLRLEKQSKRTTGLKAYLVVNKLLIP